MEELDDFAASSVHRDVEETLRQISDISQKAARTKEDVLPYLARITNMAQTFGLSNVTLDTLVRAILGSPRIDSFSCTVLINNLFPSEHVASSIVFAIVAKLGTGSHKAAPAVQSQLLRWLILIADLLYEPGCISKVYGILLNLLDMTPLRDHLCHLLCLFTEPHHVQPLAAKTIIELRKSPNWNEHIISLLSCYRAVRPDLIPEELCVGKAASLDYPDPSWKVKLQRIQSNASTSVLGDETTAQFRVAQRNARGKRRARQRLVETDTEEGQEALEGITGVKDFVQKLPSIVRPDHMEAVLDDPLLQQYMATGPDDIAELDGEVDRILGRVFREEIQSIKKGNSLTPKAIQNLKKILEYAQFQKFLPNSTEHFVIELLKTDEARNNLDLLLEVLSWRYPDSHAWSDSILPSEVETDILQRNDGAAEVLLRHYASVLRNRTAMFMSGTSAFEGNPGDAPTNLASHASYLAMSILARSQSVKASATVISYLCTLASVSKEASWENEVPVFNIETPTVYLLLFANPTVCNLSHICALLADYKQVVETIVGQTQVGQRPTKYPSDLIKRMNGFLMDSCNLFWRSRAFSTKPEDKNAVGCMLKREVEQELSQYLQSLRSEYPLGGAFSLACHPALTALAAAAWTGLEARTLQITERELLTRRLEHFDYRENKMEIDGASVQENGAEERKDRDVPNALHAGPITRASLQRLDAAGGVAISWSHFRLSVLEWLDRVGSPGIGKLMRRTMKLLMDKTNSGSSQMSPLGLTPVQTPVAG